MIRTNIEDEYFDWLFDIVCKDRYSEKHSYRKLLTYLHDTEFLYTIPKDINRAEDGVELRWWFALEYDDDHDFRDYIMDRLEGPCSVLEMIVALAYRCEEIMDDTQFGDRTGQWFWRMIVNLGLGSMNDANYDESYVEDMVNAFLDRDYEPNGHGGLFTIRNCTCDLRQEEIWTQMTWYLNSIT